MAASTQLGAPPCAMPLPPGTRRPPAPTNTAPPLALADTGRFMDQDVSLCWIYVHMIEEYVRHNGHADLVREHIDGTAGVWRWIRQHRPSPMTVLTR